MPGDAAVAERDGLQLEQPVAAASAAAENRACEGSVVRIQVRHFWVRQKTDEYDQCELNKLLDHMRPKSAALGLAS